MKNEKPPTERYALQKPTLFKHEKGVMVFVATFDTVDEAFEEAEKLCENEPQALYDVYLRSYVYKRGYVDRSVTIELIQAIRKAGEGA
jgi:hypothetical protein